MPLALLLLLLSTPVLADTPGHDVYRWTDENGLVHYGTRPPGDHAQRVLTRTPAAVRKQGHSEKARAEKRRKLLESYARERQLKREQEKRQQEEERRNARRCKELTRHWKDLSHHGPIYYQNAQGDRRYLDESERQAEKDALQKQIRQVCGKRPDL